MKPRSDPFVGNEYLQELVETVETEAPIDGIPNPLNTYPHTLRTAALFHQNSFANLVVLVSLPLGSEFKPH
jgi:hypothetical protein